MFVGIFQLVIGVWKGKVSRIDFGLSSPIEARLTLYSRVNNITEQANICILRRCEKNVMMHWLYVPQFHCIKLAKLFAIYKFLIDIILHQIIYFVFKTSEHRKKDFHFQLSSNSFA